MARRRKPLPPMADELRALRAAADILGFNPADPETLDKIERMIDIKKQVDRMTRDHVRVGTIEDVEARMAYYPDLVRAGVDAVLLYAIELYAIERVPSVAALQKASLPPPEGQTPTQFLVDWLGHPAISAYLKERQADAVRAASTTLEEQLHRLLMLSRSAEEEGNYAAAVSAEKLRSAMAGLDTDRRRNVNDDVGKDQLVNQLESMLKDNPHLAFALAKVVPGVILDRKLVDPETDTARANAILDGLRVAPAAQLVDPAVQETAEKLRGLDGNEA